KRLGSQFNEELITAAQRAPRQIASNPGDYAAVEVTRVPLAVRPVTGDTAVTRELTAAVQDLIATHTARDYVGVQPFAVPGTAGPRLRAVARVVRASNSRAGVLVVARPVAAVNAQVGQMASTAHQITTRGDLTARMPDADDSTEVGRLGAAINTMLDRIQHAF